MSEASVSAAAKRSVWISVRCVSSPSLPCAPGIRTRHGSKLEAHVAWAHTCHFWLNHVNAELQPSADNCCGFLTNPNADRPLLASSAPSPKKSPEHDLWTRCLGYKTPLGDSSSHGRVTSLIAKSLKHLFSCSQAEFSRLGEKHRSITHKLEHPLGAHGVYAFHMCGEWCSMWDNAGRLLKMIGKITE